MRNVVSVSGRPFVRFGGLGVSWGLILALSILNSCSQICSIPVERTPELRIVNAMPDQPNLLVYVDSNLVQASSPYLLGSSAFGYVATYANGKPIQVGDRKKILVLSLAQDTLIDTTIGINEHRHTLVIFGKLDRPDLRKIILFDDEQAVRDLKQGKFRFVDAIPDLPAMDVYFEKYTTGFKPDLQLHYGDSLGYSVVQQAPGITITVAGDTNQVIFSFSIPGFSLNGFFSTILLRGEKLPVKSEPTVGVDVMYDDPPGQVIYPLQTFGVRFVNATPILQLNLMPQGPSDGGPRDNLPGQKLVLQIDPDSVSDWSPFNPFYHGSNANGNVSWSFGTIDQVGAIRSLYSFGYKPHANVRYTMIAMNDAALGRPVIADAMILADTIPPPALGSSRLRIVNLSPDHTFVFTIGGNAYTMTQRDIKTIDLPPGSLNFQLYDLLNPSISLESVGVTLPDGVPRTLFFFPDQTAGIVPYRVGVE